MTPTGRLELQDWMTAPETQAVIGALTVDGASVRFVGGCVRDTLAGRPVNDVDIATHLPPETVQQLLKNAGLKAIPTGIEHGTVTAVANHKHFEITTLREDLETYGRHAKVAFTDDWKADAARRDLTINALFCAPDGTLYDPFGGADDLKAGRVRFVGDARARIEEDYLRLLRFFRFHAFYGRGAPDEEGLAAARACAPQLTTLSGERVRSELLRLLTAADPVPVLDIMLDAGILDGILPEAGNTAALKELLSLESAGQPFDPILRFAALLDTDRAGAKALAERLRLSREERLRLGDLIGPPFAAAVDMDVRDLRHALHRFGAARLRDLLLLDLVHRRVAGEAVPQAHLDRAMAEVDAWTPKPFPLQGRDAIAAGIKAGPNLGRWLAEVETWWVDQDFQPSRDECLARLQALAAA